jgi:predicted dehydrogenase
MAKDGKLGVALVGLGKYSTQQLAPALKESRYCYLAGIVTGSEEKAKAWKKKYSLSDHAVYNYDNFDSIADNEEIDIVYVVLPNSMHHRYVIKAANAGKHVICEKPMAVTVEECDEMIEACNRNNVKLSVGYRLHFDSYNMEMMRLGRNQEMGKVKVMELKNGMKDVDGWRLKKALAGGGSLMDLGIYCVQGAVYTIGEDPVAVTATLGHTGDEDKFKEVEDNIYWNLEFPGGAVAKCYCSYSNDEDYLKAETDDGWFGLTPAFDYKGLRGATSDHQKIDFGNPNQQAAQLDNFAVCIMENRESPVSGEMGKRDVKILQAIYQAAKSGERVLLQL